jgi:hypothetical protein
MVRAREDGNKGESYRAVPRITHSTDRGRLLDAVRTELSDPKMKPLARIQTQSQFAMDEYEVPKVLFSPILLLVGTRSSFVTPVFAAQS